ncbi:tetratricopeptide repeat protein [Paraburkholderia terrae]|uniref:tetratricopeptide repeat protein n=1 Tax=Paraburkholderia terrae TaxID=311230 RepID=UPI00206E8FCC|nr:tetratricopeptide repeat protein [Paraburkholderia terrae]BDC39916.1 hypothetical protein PTKU15_32130 [Paraburkholderia terrae]
MNDALSPVDLANEFDLAVERHQAGRYHEAEESYRRILSVLPENPDANHLLGSVLEETAGFAAAEPYFQVAIGAAPQEPRFWSSYIGALIRAGHRVAAEHMIIEAKKYGVDGIALGLSDAQAPAAATEVISNETVNMVMSEFMSTLAVLFDKGRFEEAEDVARQWTDLMPVHGLAWKVLAIALREQGRLAAALDPLRKAAALLPDDGDVKDDLARATTTASHASPAIIPLHGAPQPTLTYANAAALRPGSRSYQHLAGALVANVPVIIPTFNNVTHLRRIIPQLQDIGMRNLIVVDNASSAPEMLACLDELQPKISVVRLDHNAGPRAIFQVPANYGHLPDIFCITDPDLQFNDDLPREFLFELIEATEHFRIGKAGFALDISQPELIKQGCFRYNGKEYTICEWESRFWQHQIGATAAGDPIFNAPIDTTFAVYNKRYFNPKQHICGVRFAGRFTARHLPWYEDSGMSVEEETYYRQNQKWSNYLAST